MSGSAATAEDLRELYRELILDHARNPRNFGKPAHVTHIAEGINPLCGDKLKMYLHIDAEGQIRDAAFEGSGCAISVASASLLTDTIIGLPVADALNYFAAIVAALTGGASMQSRNGLELDKLRALEGVKEFPSRVKCATLAWHAMRSAIEHHDQPVSTE